MEKPIPKLKNANSPKNHKSDQNRENNQFNLSEQVPLMFQASIQGRCQLQREGKNRQSQIYEWTEQWTQNYPHETKKSNTNNEKSSVNLALARPKNNNNSQSQTFVIPTPKFSKQVKTKEYKIAWRLVTNCGQDDIIRPIIGAKGYPYYSGASMKGVFLRACPLEKRNLYCGYETQGESHPGILRFHGAYPVDNSWVKNLVDLVHSQQNKQVIRDESTNAVKQISLYKITLRFGISSNKSLDEQEWNEIWQIWEKALSFGLGSRVSASYGHFENISPAQELLKVKIKGQGIAPTLTDRDKTPEFRPNIFKAVLRGHTMRLFGGITDERTAKQLTNILWGGIEGVATVGLLGVAFQSANYTLKPIDKYTKTFQLKEGTLIIFLTKSNVNNETKAELKKIADLLVKFSMLLGGFGKSWRRVDHSIFFPDYSKYKIGCHWQFFENQNFFGLSNENDLKIKINNFIDDIVNKLKTWASKQVKKLSTNTICENWREHWSKKYVRVYGRIANSKMDSKAVKWFHQNYSENKSIKEISLTGGLGKTSRIWHRMYPYQNDKYVELLTIFPDDSDKTKDFLEFLSNQTEFEQLW